MHYVLCLASVENSLTYVLSYKTSRPIANIRDLNIIP